MPTKSNKTSELFILKNNKNQLNLDESLEEGDSDNSIFNEENKPHRNRKPLNLKVQK